MGATKKNTKKSTKKKAARKKDGSEIVARNLATGESLTFSGYDGTVQFRLGKETVYAEVAERLAGGVMLRLRVGLFNNMRIIPVGSGEVLVEAVSEKRGARKGG